MPTTAGNILLLLSLLFTSAGSAGHYHRHLLHQPFLPLTTTTPPTQAPTLSPQPQPRSQTRPKYPFSTTTPPNNNAQKPFFPSFPSPPPPPPLTSLATFPANISSLLFPRPPSSSASHRSHIIIVTTSIALSLLVLLAATLSAFLLCSRRRHRNLSASEKADSLRLFPPNTVPSDGSPKPPKLPPNRPNSTSSEFLYLGTLVNSRGEINDHHNLTNQTNVAVGIGVSSSPYQKLGSPELKPLPPLPKHNYTPSYRSGEVLVSSCKEDEEGESDTEEEFFSPRGSSGRRETLGSPAVRVGSSSRREFQGESNFGSRSFNSRTASYPYSNSCSPSNSVSTSPSQVLNLSPGSAKSNKSSDNIISFAVPVQSVKRSPASLSLSSSSSLNSPEQKLDSLWQNKQSPASSENGSKRFVPIKLPPPPPPLPPPRFWEAPTGVRVARVTNIGSSGPPVLVTPSRAILVNEQLESSVGSERRDETTPKPKLKPLHWDKVRACSDRAMVWDQIKSSSFQ